MPAAHNGIDTGSSPVAPTIARGHVGGEKPRKREEGASKGSALAHVPAEPESGVPPWPLAILYKINTSMQNISMEQENRSVGRPTKYDPSYCESVIEYMAHGYSLTAFAGSIRVARSTINEWINNYPEFSEACKIAQACRTEDLEKGLLEADSGPQVTARIFALKNSDPENWRERREVDLSSSDGSMTPKPAIDVSSLSSEALREIVAAARASDKS